MHQDPSAAHWSTLDQWWDTYAQTTAATQPTLSPTAHASVAETDIPKDIDTWWAAYSDDTAGLSNALSGFDDRSLADAWTELEPWWDAYMTARADDVDALERVLAQSSDLWDQEGPFGADPLAADLGRRMHSGDPLHPGVEEEWSDWLAQLLRTDDGAFHRELFGEGVPAPPRRVTREAHLPNPDGTDRYADILTVHDSGGISIEVKVGDTNFGKTTDTTALIEAHRYGTWHHYLLVPEGDVKAVRASVDEDLAAGEGDREVITAEGSDPVALRYWSDVSRALRTVLLDDATPDPHWAASAYLFCTQIEQQRLGFTPEPVVEQIADEASRVQSFESVSVGIDDLESQIKYLEAFVEDTNE